jgi:hypothetical protein
MHKNKSINRKMKNRLNLRHLIIISSLLIALNTFAQTEDIWILSATYKSENDILLKDNAIDKHNMILSFNHDTLLVLSSAKGVFSNLYIKRRDSLYLKLDDTWKFIGSFKNKNTLWLYSPDGSIGVLNKINTKVKGIKKNELITSIDSHQFAINYSDLFHIEDTLPSSGKIQLSYFGELTTRVDLKPNAIYSLGRFYFLLITYESDYIFQIKEIKNDMITLLSAFKTIHEIKLSIIDK